MSTPARVIVFDTTLRDGEQAPGYLDGRAGEAGDGAGARRARRRHHRGRVPDRVAGGRRGGAADCRQRAAAGHRRAGADTAAGHRRGGALARAGRALADSHLPRHLRPPPHAPSCASRARSASSRRSPRVKLARAVHRRCGVFGGGRDAQRSRFPVPRDRGGDRRRLRPPSTCRTRSATRRRTRCATFFAEHHRPRAERRSARSSARTATTTSGSRSPTASRRSRAACGRSSARSTASASAPATRRSRSS